jgi:putative aminopeptidase FrvX
MPDDLLALLLELVRLPGVPGAEKAVADKLNAIWAPLSDEVRRTPAGSLHAVRHGRGRRPRPSIMLAAHMDAVGLVVVEVEGSLLRVACAGAIAPQQLPGQRVLIQGRRLIPGIVVQPPGEEDGTVPVGAFCVDTGLSPRQLQSQVRVGDPITFDRMPIRLGNGLVSGPSLDNRVGLAALSMALQSLARSAHAWDVVAVGTVQEELAALGARTSARAAPPTLALVIDTTYGRGHGEAEHVTFPLGGGPTNGWGPIAHPAIHERLHVAAERLEIPLTLEPMPRYSESDADTVQIVGAGTPTGCLFIPVRYMHSPVEVVDLDDIRRTATLVAEFVRGLNESAGYSWMEMEP